MFKLYLVRGVSAFIALVASVAVSAHAALATNLPDPIGPIGGSGSGTDRLPGVPAPSPGLQILGMDWQLALAVAVFVIAALLLLASVVQRRHVAHA